MPKRKDRHHPASQQKKSDFETLFARIFCLSPTNSPDTSPAHSTPSSEAADALSKPLLHQLRTQQTLPLKVEQDICETEWAEREKIEKAFFHEHEKINEIKLLFSYALSYKLLCMQKDFDTYSTAMQQTLCGIHTLMRLDLAKQEAVDRAKISGDAQTEYTELKTLFEDDEAALEPGDNFDDVSSSSRFFQPAPADTANDTSVKKASWFSWLSR